MSKRKIIFATKNKGKIKEINAVLGETYEIVSMEDAGIDIDVVEDGSTFEENALIKATEIMKLSNEIVLADDSGLEIDYLNKEPGVHSARYMGKDTSYDIKNKKILDIMKDVSDDKRTARFVCCIAAALPEPYNKTLTVRGTIEGIIGYDIQGENGFGYDPIFYLPDRKCTTAELSMKDKNEISHRGKALRLMKAELEKIIGE